MWWQEVGNRERDAWIMPSHSRIEPKSCMGLLRELNSGLLTPDARIIPVEQVAKWPQKGEPTNAEHGLVAATCSRGEHILQCLPRSKSDSEWIRARRGGQGWQLMLRPGFKSKCVHAYWMQSPWSAERYPANLSSHGTQRRSPCGESEQHMLTTARSYLRTAFGDKSLHTTARVAY